MSIILPNAKDITKTLDMMIGETPLLKAGDETIDLANPPAGTYVSWLNDNDGETMGAIITTLSAAVYLGGTMIMIPAGGQEDQVKEGEASEAVVDSMTEINNMLRGLFNRYHDNAHVSPSPMEFFEAPAEDDPQAWVHAPAERMNYAGTLPYGEGHMVILTR